ncbi:tRNA (adenosine(37)-N6)-dimethylallyltransferase MiaA [Xanthomarina sp. F2636L]|uniref:tRNA (adenosine(37)-N6)-dimethylallyltransferase MiaA n=1 Tax=Xanthomarina sp. F2636L TaxID=2996018 RepID=UPI00225E41B2|nr:tRNA (adenosine(37)-N6)-dimethylallyltransferase MiaA [Xanthomarina sp. F2636L]MCX7552179.1 tRNA (adenosine(37)-N6)-dimethylallyltransferase MiaA [Xanthomarina sp. F2636L]
MEKCLIAIVGPTAIGKTALSIKLANYFRTEIVSADSRQFFKEMQIGTAAPTPTELAAATHHFIHHKSIEDQYNVGAFEKDALEVLEQLFNIHDVVIMVGGSGLYVDAVIYGLDRFPEVDSNIRLSLNKQLETEGLETLQKKLKALDPESYKNIAIDNPQRVIRALEICMGSGKPYSSFLNKEKVQRPFKTITIGLTAEREVIYNRINQRVDLMVQHGLIDEVKTLQDKQHLNALNTVGYKEVFKYLEGDWSLDFALSEIKKNSRRFAKRQLTWFRKKEDTMWFDFETPLDIIIDYINSTLKNKSN